MAWTEAEASACQRLVDWALAEDLGERGDITSECFVPQSLSGRAVLVARSPGVLAGLVAVRRVLERVSTQIVIDLMKNDGDALLPGERIAVLSGPVRAILAAERTGLNFLQRLSGVATQTHKFVEAVAGLSARILDTRKTTPGWRLLEKYAVRMGGGSNHRVGLWDAILVKDNHLAALAHEAGPREGKDLEEKIMHRIAQARAALPGVTIEIEVDTPDQCKQILGCRPDIVLLDNMSRDLMRQCVLYRNAVAPGVQLEASGGVNLATVRAIAETGVDRISVGALTHSAPALDIALDYLD